MPSVPWVGSSQDLSHFVPLLQIHGVFLSHFFFFKKWVLGGCQGIPTFEMPKKAGGGKPKKQGGTGVAKTEAGGASGGASTEEWRLRCFAIAKKSQRKDLKIFFLAFRSGGGHFLKSGSAAVHAGTSIAIF